MDAKELAERFHEAYERLAPQFGYTTRPETRVFDPESNNGRLMIAAIEEVCGNIANMEGTLARMVDDARIDMDAMRRRHAEEMARYGCPFVNSVVSREDGYFLTHQIIESHPTPSGLKVIIAATKMRDCPS